MGGVTVWCGAPPLLIHCPSFHGGTEHPVNVLSRGRTLLYVEFMLTCTIPMTHTLFKAGPDKHDIYLNITFEPRCIYTISTLKASAAIKPPHPIPKPAEFPTKVRVDPGRYGAEYYPTGILEFSAI